MTTIADSVTHTTSLLLGHDDNSRLSYSHHITVTRTCSTLSPPSLYPTFTLFHQPTSNSTTFSGTPSNCSDGIPVQHILVDKSKSEVRWNALETVATCWIDWGGRDVRHQTQSAEQSQSNSSLDPCGSDSPRLETTTGRQA